MRSTGIVVVSTLLSRVLGFLRDMLTAKYFGASGNLDGFFVAFRIPNLFRRLVAEGALTVSFIPIYMEYRLNYGDDEARLLAQKTLSILLVILGVIVSLGIVFSPEIVRIIAYGFSSPEKIELTVALNRLMFPYLVMVSIVAFAMGVLNSHDRFFAPAFSPVLLNVGFIFGIISLSAFFDEPLYGLAVGVLIGGVLQVLLQIPYMIKAGFRIKFSLDFNHPGIRKIFSLVIPTLFGFAIYQINILMSTLLASFLPDGSISYLYYSDRLTEMVLGIFIVSMGSVLLPAMSRISAAENIDGLKNLYTKSISAALFLAVPAGVALMTAGIPIVSVLFMRDKFSAHHAIMTERALFYSSMGVASVALLRITTPAFYSLKDTRIPVLTAFVSFIINIILGYILMKTHMAHAGLSLAGTVSVSIQVILLMLLLRKKIGKLNSNPVFYSAVKFLIASGVMAIVLWGISQQVDWFHDSILKRAAFLTIMVLSGSMTYLASCAIMRVSELQYLFERIRARLSHPGR